MPLQKINGVWEEYPPHIEKKVKNKTIKAFRRNKNSGYWECVFCGMNWWRTRKYNECPICKANIK